MSSPQYILVLSTRENFFGDVHNSCSILSCQVRVAQIEPEINDM